jgi:hypothetical protein
VVTSCEDLVEKVQVFIFLETVSLLNAEIETLQVAWSLQCVGSCSSKHKFAAVSYPPVYSC